MNLDFLEVINPNINRNYIIMQIEEHLVSIITPSYNSEKFISETIQVYQGKHIQIGSY